MNRHTPMVYVPVVARLSIHHVRPGIACVVGQNQLNEGILSATSAFKAAKRGRVPPKQKILFTVEYPLNLFEKGRLMETVVRHNQVKSVFRGERPCK